MAEREQSLTWTKSVARWSRDGRAAYEAEREALLFVLFLFGRCTVFQSGRKLLHEGTFFFLSEFSGLIFIILAVLLCRAVFCLLNIQHIRVYQKKKISTLPAVCTYVRHMAFGLFS